MIFSYPHFIRLLPFVEIFTLQCIYGAVLALRAAIQLGETKIAKLVLFEPPLTLDADAEQNDRESAQIIAELLAANKRSELLSLYLSDKMAPGIVTHMKKRTEWQYMQAVAHTLAYENAIMSDCSKLVQSAKAATMPVLLLNNSEIPLYILQANEALAQTMPQAQHVTLDDIWSKELEDGSLQGIDDSILIEFLNNPSATHTW